jgi:hypothetical protein
VPKKKNDKGEQESVNVMTTDEIQDALILSGLSYRIVDSRLWDIFSFYLTSENRGELC